MRGALATWDPERRSLVREEIVIDTRDPVKDSKNDRGQCHLPTVLVRSLWTYSFRGGWAEDRQGAVNAKVERMRAGEGTYFMERTSASRQVLLWGTLV